MYVAIWFYIATFITVALLHVVNSLELPVSLLKSYSMYAGVQDALVQWWYGHNAVAFFLTTPFLGMMYYFLPKAANRPVFSYRLSIVHFWSLIFLYIWAGPHHLLYTALPDWAQTLGTVFSIMLIAPSWGGMVNGLLTLRGAWDRVRERPGAEVHGRRRHRLRHGDVRRADDVAQERQRAHALHRLHHRPRAPRARWPGTAAWRSRCSTTSCRASTAPSCTRRGSPTCTSGWRRSGILFYAIPMYVAGITQSLMWQEFTADGALRYPQLPRDRRPPGADVCAAGGGRHALHGRRARRRLQPVSDGAAGRAHRRRGGRGAAAGAGRRPDRAAAWHRSLESRPVQFAVLTFVAVVDRRRRRVRARRPSSARTCRRSPSVKPYTPLEVEGRDLYIREGCVGCHSQMIRPMRAETARYGDYSKAGEFVYDHPFLWGSKRTGPDLHRDRRQVSGLLALRPHEAAARDVAGIDHAGLPVALRRRARHVAHRRQGHHAAPARRAVSGRATSAQAAS